MRVRVCVLESTAKAGRQALAYSLTHSGLPMNEKPPAGIRRRYSCIINISVRIGIVRYGNCRYTGALTEALLLVVLADDGKGALVGWVAGWLAGCDTIVYIQCVYTHGIR